MQRPHQADSSSGPRRQLPVQRVLVGFGVAVPVDTVLLVRNTHGQRGPRLRRVELLGQRLGHQGLADIGVAQESDAEDEVHGIFFNGRGGDDTFVNNTGVRSIAVGGDGSLSPLATVPGIPAGANGLAVR